MGWFKEVVAVKGVDRLYPRRYAPLLEWVERAGFDPLTALPRNQRGSSAMTTGHGPRTPLNEAQHLWSRTPPPCARERPVQNLTQPVVGHTHWHLRRSYPEPLAHQARTLTPRPEDARLVFGTGAMAPTFNGRWPVSKTG